MSDELDQERAFAVLASARSVTRRVQDRTRWIGLYFIAFGLGFGGEVLIAGLIQPLALKMTVFFVSFSLLMVVLLAWALAQRAVPRNRFRGAWAWAATSTLYGMSLIAGLGIGALQGRLGYWVPASVIVALPLCAAGWREYRT